MPPSEQNTDVRVGSDGETVETPSEATDEVIVAQVPGDDPSKFVTLTLAHPLNEKDRVYLGLDPEARTEVGQKVKVNRNGAQAIINAGYATIDPEDNETVQQVLRGDAVASEPEEEQTSEPVIEDVTEAAPEVQTSEPVVEGLSGEPTAEPPAEGMSSPLENPPMAKSTPGSSEPSSEAIAEATPGETEAPSKSGSKRSGSSR